MAPRTWIYRISLIINLGALLYVAVLITPTIPPSPTLSDQPSNDPPISNIEIEDDDLTFQLVDTNTVVLNDTLQQSQNRSKLFPCNDYTPTSHYGQRGNYWVLYNYFSATRTFHCDESITYTTHADWTYLDNLEPLLERWQGPISITLYSPGTDFVDSVRRIVYLRECTNSTLVKELVSFHLFFDHDAMPKTIIPRSTENLTVNCKKLQKAITYGEDLSTFKKENEMFYPVNVARNVAREMASTHYVLPSDIELYPSPNLIPQFLKMIQRNDTVLHRPVPKTFVLPIFEVEANVTRLPYNKTELADMIFNKSAIFFHQYVCKLCHRIPYAGAWVNATVEPELEIFHIGKRKKPHHYWEPIYIGTKSEPVYDERLSWEGQRDKQSQGYVLCVLDYEFMILNNAFLVHRPGIKRKKVTIENEVVKKQKNLITTVILPELMKLYGTRQGCSF